MTYRSSSTRFLDEFGVDIATVESKERGHAVSIGSDYECIVRPYIEINGFEYWSSTVIFDSKSFSSHSDDLIELCEDLGLKPTKENRAAVKARLIKADLWGE